MTPTEQPIAPHEHPAVAIHRGLVLTRLSKVAHATVEAIDEGTLFGAGRLYERGLQMLADADLPGEQLLTAHEWMSAIPSRAKAAMRPDLANKWRAFYREHGGEE